MQKYKKAWRNLFYMIHFYGSLTRLLYLNFKWDMRYPFSFLSQKNSNPVRRTDGSILISAIPLPLFGWPYRVPDWNCRD